MNQKQKNKKQPAKSKGQLSQVKNTMSQPKQQRQVLNLSKCATDYARCLVNPFSGPLACVPNFPALMSRKVRVWAKGVMVTGTVGVGFVYADPQRGAVNDLSCVNYSGALFTGTSFRAPPTVGVGASTSNADYVNAQIGANLITFRVVSSGIRIRYIGTELDRGGYAVALSDTNHNSLWSRDIAAVDAEINSKRFPITRNWITVVFRPVRDADDEFGGTSAETPAVTDLSFYQGVIVAAPSTDPISFEFEYYSVYEYQGATSRGQTPSHVDVVGYGAVSQTTNFSKHLQPYEGHAAPKEKPLVDDTKKTLANSLSGFVPIVQGGLDIASGNYLKGGIEVIEGLWDLF